MVLGTAKDYAEMLLKCDDAHIGEQPFPRPYEDFKVVPDKAVIFDLLWDRQRVALVSFECDPKCSPHENCPPISSWKKPREKFLCQLGYGSGLLVGRTEACGHMCAWNGQAVYDPRGFIYSFNLAVTMGFYPDEFWLAVK